MADEWIMDYAVLIGNQGGVFMNFLKTIIAHITDCQVHYDAQVLDQHSERLAVQSVLLPTLQKIVPIDAFSMNLPIRDAIRHAISKGLNTEGMDALIFHALHVVLAIVVRADEPGMGLCLSNYTSFNQFEDIVSSEFLAKVVVIFMKTGSSTLLHDIIYFLLLKNNRLIIIFVSWA
jgi:hypothetical protein